jgi:hypothetical protein
MFHTHTWIDPPLMLYLLGARASGFRSPVAARHFLFTKNSVHTDRSVCAQRSRPWGSRSLLQCVWETFPGVKRPGRGVDHPFPSNAGFGKKRSYKPTSPLCFHSMLQGEIYFTLTLTLYSSSNWCRHNSVSSPTLPLYVQSFSVGICSPAPSICRTSFVFTGRETNKLIFICLAKLRQRHRFPFSIYFPLFELSLSVNKIWKPSDTEGCVRHASGSRSLLGYLNKAELCNCDYNTTYVNWWPVFSFPLRSFFVDFSVQLMVMFIYLIQIF